MKTILFIMLIFLSMSLCYYDTPNCIQYKPGLHFYPDYNCTSSDPMELEALVALYESMGGNNWLSKGNWMNTSISVCAWGGVDCDYHCSIVGLSIIHNNVKGPYPKEMAYLKNLTNCYMMCNSISGGLNNLLELHNINEFNLRSNEIYEEMIDPNIFPQVFNFVLSYNYIYGTIPDINLPGLGNLELCYNNLTGSIPQINSSKSLTVQLNNNNLSGVIPSFDFGKLSYLDLSFNQLSGTIPQNLFTNNKDLKSFKVNHNNLVGSIPSKWQTLERLSEVYLNNNALTGEFDTSIAGLLRNSYKIVSVANNQLSGNIKTSGTVVFNSIILSNNNFTGNIDRYAVWSHLIDIRGNVNMVVNKYSRNLIAPIDSYMVYENLLCPYIKVNIPYQSAETIILSNPQYYNFTYCKSIEMF